MVFVRFQNRGVEIAGHNTVRMTEDPTHPAAPTQRLIQERLASVGGEAVNDDLAVTKLIVVGRFELCLTGVTRWILNTAPVPGVFSRRLPVERLCGGLIYASGLFAYNGASASPGRLMRTIRSPV
jgi:hypothetical protein